MISDPTFIAWEGRSFVPAKTSINLDNNRPQLRILSYHVLADNKCKKLTYTSAKSWDERKITLLQEIRSYEAEIIMLQDVDHFADWWRPKLMTLGYDCIFKKRTETKESHDEGVVVGYKRDRFQLFKSIPINFNHAADGEIERGGVYREKCKTDDVALIAFLQPFTYATDRFRSALCVCCALFNDKESNEDVRLTQAEYLCKQIELSNSDFQVPVVIGAALYDLPTSPAYHLLRTGRVSLRAQAPRKCKPPKGVPTCRGSVRITWFPPPITPADPFIYAYRVAWRPGGSLPLGYRLQKEVLTNDCVQFVEKTNAKGEICTIALEQLATVVTGLTCELPYEFRITAVNEVGEGIWSEASQPVILPNASKAPAMPDLVFFKGISGVLELREQTSMVQNDFDVHTIQTEDEQEHACVTPRKFNGTANWEAPRGRVLPIGVNPRKGWKTSLRGSRNPDIFAELNIRDNMRRTILRKAGGVYIDGLCDEPTGKIIFYGDDISRDETRSSLVEDSSTVTTATSPELHHTVGSATLGSNSASIAVGEFEIGSHMQESGDSTNDGDDGLSEVDGMTASSSPLAPSQLNLASVFADYDQDNSDGERQSRSPRIDDDTVLDARAIVEALGKPDPRQRHTLALRSAYESYCSAGEPAYTTSYPADPQQRNGASCLDYLFFSGQSMAAVRVLTLPTLGSLRGDDGREPPTVPDPFWDEPHPGVKDCFSSYKKLLYATVPSIKQVRTSGLAVADAVSTDSRSLSGSRATVADMKKKLRDSLAMSAVASDIHRDHFWGGKWLPYPTANPAYIHSWLPNNRFCSSHLAMCVELEILEGYAASQWV